MNRARQTAQPVVAPKARHRTRPPSRGVVICDLDGTLARRHQPVGPRVAVALAAVAGAGWRICILSGQSLSNLKPRLVSVLKFLGRVPGALEDLSVLTCEGANEWRLNGPQWLRLPDATGVKGHVSRDDQEGVILLMRSKLNEILPRGVRLLQPPMWLEEAMCIMKVDARLGQRRLLADRLEAIFRRHGLTSLRVGLGGTFSIVITHHRTHKGTVLEQIVKTLGPCERAIYLADEFAVPGNDVAALSVRKLIRIDFGRSQCPASQLVSDGGGTGPRAVVGWLRRLARSSSHSVFPAAAVIQSTPQAGFRHPKNRELNKTPSK